MPATTSIWTRCRGVIRSPHSTRATVSREGTHAVVTNVGSVTTERATTEGAATEEATTEEATGAAAAKVTDVTTAETADAAVGGKGTAQSLDRRVGPTTCHGEHPAEAPRTVATVVPRTRPAGAATREPAVTTHSAETATREAGVVTELAEPTATARRDPETRTAGLRERERTHSRRAQTRQVPRTRPGAETPTVPHRTRERPTGRRCRRAQSVGGRPDRSWG